MASFDNKLKKYYVITGRSLYDLAKVTGISRPTLMRLMDNKCSDVLVSKAISIKKVTGLEPFQYIPKLAQHRKMFR